MRGSTNGIADHLTQCNGKVVAHAVDDAEFGIRDVAGDILPAGNRDQLIGRAVQDKAGGRDGGRLE
jgi:hypothetical protein